MKDQFKGKVIIVTGGTGSIGSEIVRQLMLTEAAQIRIFSRDEHKQHELRRELGEDERLRYLIGDIRDKERLDFAFRGVDICLHAAALKHVPVCEYNPFEAIKTNVYGTQNVIDVSIKYDLEKVIAISNDNAVDPESVLGASKLMMERLVTAANWASGTSRTRFASVRFGNVLNSRGSVVHMWRAQVEAGGPVTVTDKRMSRFFMNIPEAVTLIFNASELMHGGEIFVLKMESRPIVQYAKEIIREYSGGKKIEIAFTGLRPGEKLKEALYTEEEKSHMIETDTMYIITPLQILETRQGTPRYSYPGMRIPGMSVSRKKIGAKKINKKKSGKSR
jgi:FlaA1/EpsC-like NDP-sugar epimerase